MRLRYLAVPATLLLALLLSSVAPAAAQSWTPLAPAGGPPQTTVMEQRFVSVKNVRLVPLNVWMPGDVAKALLMQVGISEGDIVGLASNAAITSVDHASCTEDPANGNTLAAGVNGPGILSFHARIHLVN